MLSYKLDFSYCVIMLGFGKSSHIYRYRLYINQRLTPARLIHRYSRMHKLGQAAMDDLYSIFHAAH